MKVGHTKMAGYNCTFYSLISVIFSFYTKFSMMYQNNDITHLYLVDLMNLRSKIGEIRTLMTSQGSNKKSFHQS